MATLNLNLLQLPDIILEEICSYLKFQDIINFQKTCKNAEKFLIDFKIKEKKTLIIYKIFAKEWHVMYCDKELLQNHITWKYFKNYLHNKNERQNQLGINKEIIKNLFFLKQRHKITSLLFFNENTWLPPLPELEHLLNFIKNNKLVNVQELLSLIALPIYCNCHSKKKFKYVTELKSLTFQELKVLKKYPPYMCTYSINTSRVCAPI